MTRLHLHPPKPCACSDLISSADTIIDIARSCQRLVELTGGLQGGLGALAAGAAAGGGAPPTPAASSYDRLYALGSRIKYLIDTPETIYGCLDGREFLAAARRFVRAAEVHRVLTAGQAKQVAQRFPLLQHQWPLVKKFRPQVYNAAGTWLGSHGELSAAQAAAALAAQALLKPMDGAEVGWAGLGLGGAAGRGAPASPPARGHEAFATAVNIPLHLSAGRCCSSGPSALPARVDAGSLGAPPPAVTQVLKAFLTARQAYIMQCLSGAAAAGADTDLDSLAFILADVATMVRAKCCGSCNTE